MHWCLICFGISKCHHQGIRYEHAEMVPNVVKSREGWELYIVTDGVMVGIYAMVCKKCCIFMTGNTLLFTFLVPLNDQARGILKFKCLPEGKC
jgi:hypothetical protein